MPETSRNALDVFAAAAEPQSKQTAPTLPERPGGGIWGGLCPPSHIGIFFDERPDFVLKKIGKNWKKMEKTNEKNENLEST